MDTAEGQAIVNGTFYKSAKTDVIQSADPEESSGMQEKSDLSAENMQQTEQSEGEKDDNESKAD